MCIYHVLINALSAHMIHVNLNMIWIRIWICTLQGPFLAIFAMELGERNANIKFVLKKNSMCSFILQSLF